MLNGRSFFLLSRRENSTGVKTRSIPQNMLLLGGVARRLGTQCMQRRRRVWYGIGGDSILRRRIERCVGGVVIGDFFIRDLDDEIPHRPRAERRYNSALRCRAPRQTQSATTRTIKYISASTRSAVISISNGTNATPNTTTVSCTTTCSTQLTAPFGVDSFGRDALRSK